MGGKTLAADIKRTSVLRRLPPLGAPHYRDAPGTEGTVCAFELAPDASPIVVEAVSGRAMTLVPRDVFLATPGHRESTRWVVGGIPKRGLIPRKNYWVLSESGVVGDLVAGTPLTKSHLGRVKYLGAVCGDDDQILNIRQFAVRTVRGLDHGAAVYLFVGTSAEVGKSTAAIAVLRALLDNGHSVVALKATGTSGLSEIVKYQDFGAAQVFDCVDFGLPTTYPSNRAGIGQVFDRALDNLLVDSCGRRLDRMRRRHARRQRPGVPQASEAQTASCKSHSRRCGCTRCAQRNAPTSENETARQHDYRSLYGHSHSVEANPEIVWDTRSQYASKLTTHMTRHVLSRALPAVSRSAAVPGR